jgi:hypothetical protein
VSSELRGFRAATIAFTVARVLIEVTRARRGYVDGLSFATADYFLERIAEAMRDAACVRRIARRSARVVLALSRFTDPREPGLPPIRVS